MTGRGRSNQTARPINPPDPSLATRPVPEMRHYAFTSFGPAATGDAPVTPIQELERQADYATFPGDVDLYSVTMDVILNLLKETEAWQSIENDPTWGYYVFVIAYSDNARTKLFQAMANWVKVVERCLTIETLPIYTAEALRRFKFNLIQDQDTLDGASIDRVRAEFRAQIRGLCLREKNGDDEDQDNPISAFLPPARNLACFILDEAAIDMLAGISNIPDNLLEFLQVFKNKTITVVDGFWDPSRQNPWESYRGVGQLALSGLVEFYTDVTRSANAGAMADLHPING
ncbi:hypothetical protein MW887_004805 [Aspergillus wentii]|nr:hypothetical protein MW887_004805 [Aspergillus wentii]